MAQVHADAATQRSPTLRRCGRLTSTRAVRSSAGLPVHDGARPAAPSRRRATPTPSTHRRVFIEARGRTRPLGSSGSGDKHDAAEARCLDGPALARGHRDELIAAHASIGSGARRARPAHRRSAGRRVARRVPKQPCAPRTSSASSGSSSDDDVHHPPRHQRGRSAARGQGRHRRRGRDHDRWLPAVADDRGCRPRRRRVPRRVTGRRRAHRRQDQPARAGVRRHRVSTRGSARPSTRSTQPSYPAAPRVASAVAVATGEADVAFGTDTGGSIRRRRACCGTVGLKTTTGRIPLGGVWPLAPSLDTLGPMARDGRRGGVGHGVARARFRDGRRRRACRRAGAAPRHRSRDRRGHRRGAGYGGGRRDRGAPTRLGSR